MKSLISVILVFLSGGVVFLNLAQIKYGIPEHYNGSWFSVILGCLLAIYFGYIIIRISRKNHDE